MHPNNPSVEISKQLTQVQTYRSVEIDPSNSSLRFTHNQSVEKLLATARSGANIPERGESPSNNSLGLEHAKAQYTHFTHHIHGEQPQGHDL